MVPIPYLNTKSRNQLGSQIQPKYSMKVDFRDFLLIRCVPFNSKGWFTIVILCVFPRFQQFGRSHLAAITRSLLRLQ
ncbi:hypothetical protein Hanom_Chr16g01518511 [Helianthus anomalus]